MAERQRSSGEAFLRAVALGYDLCARASTELARAEAARQAIVELDLRDSRQLRHHAVSVRGTTANPMSREEVAAKALDLMSPTLGVERARRIIELVWRLEGLPSLSGLATLLQADPGDVLCVTARSNPL